MINYLKYVLWHKWYVFLECRKLGISWLGVIHDLSRFYPDEFFPYAASAPFNRDNKPKSIAVAFERAWNDHQHRNKHHFEYWVHFDYHTHEQRVLPIPEPYRREMLADWRGAARAQNYNKGTAKDWYFANYDDLIIHPDTRVWIRQMFDTE